MGKSAIPCMVLLFAVCFILSPLSFAHASSEFYLKPFADEMYVCEAGKTLRLATSLEVYEVGRIDLQIHSDHMKGWISMDAPTLTLAKGDKTNITITVNVPPNAYSTVYGFTLSSFFNGEVRTRQNIFINVTGGLEPPQTKPEEHTHSGWISRENIPRELVLPYPKLRYYPVKIYVVNRGSEPEMVYLEFWFNKTRLCSTSALIQPSEEKLVGSLVHPGTGEIITYPLALWGYYVGGTYNYTAVVYSGEGELLDKLTVLCQAKCPKSVNLDADPVASLRLRVWEEGGIVVYTPEQIEAMNYAREVCKKIDETGLDMNAVRNAVNRLKANGLISKPNFSFEPKVAQSFYTMLEALYGSNLQRYPTPEGRLWLLYMLKG